MDLTKYLSGKTSLNDYVHRINQNGASFQVHYWGVMPKHYDNQLHKHSFFKVCYVVEGEGTYIDNHCTYKLQENTLFLSRPEVVHQIKSEKGLSLLYVAFQLVESESNEIWIKIMEKAKQCTEIMLYDEFDLETALLWKSLLIQATKPKNEFFEEMLSTITYTLITSILQDFVPVLNKSNHKNIPEKSYI
ncbi:AraC family ligand binding domain-containing protein [Bacillus sp. SA1-12]|uniref:AraC family ligand binding domain-containing protein n=1 Tax=Bacillus sp. SA1-12 TaxID=1455638 RepID=UPI000A07D5D0|nr:AraC family ligand binding domain-containing protein [Bacillus sp. SA1-12]